MSDGLTRILVVEDNPGDAFLVAELLEEAEVSAAVTTCGRLSEALAALEASPPEVVILDLSLPDASGLEGVRRLRLARPELPIVVMSGLGDERTAVAAVQAGAQDYLVKGQVDSHLLARSLRYAVERARATALLTEQRRLAEEHAAHLAQRNAEQETFIYTVSHDLRQPLLALQGMTTLLEEAARARSTDEIEFLAARARVNVDRMGSLLDDLLAFARIGRVPEEVAEIDLGEVVRSAITDLRARPTARQPVVEVPAAWPRVRLAPTESYQVVVNLLANAFQWAGRDSSPPRVFIDWQACGDWVRLSVQDNGPGVPEAYREKVFRLFQKLDAKGDGTGVGLAIVKRIVERHGGRVWVEESPLGGANFLVTLPATGQ